MPTSFILSGFGIQANFHMQRISKKELLEKWIFTWSFPGKLSRNKLIIQAILNSNFPAGIDAIITE
jgi:hypothetical protein